MGLGGVRHPVDTCRLGRVTGGGGCSGPKKRDQHKSPGWNPQLGAIWQIENADWLASDGAKIAYSLGTVLRTDVPSNTLRVSISCCGAGR